jgi:hypothetical protein
MSTAEHDAFRVMIRLLREHFGRLVQFDAGGRISVIGLPWTHPYTVILVPHEVDGHALISVQCMVGDDISWETPGLADFALREAAELDLGRLARVDDALVVEAAVFSDGVTGEQLAQVTRSVAMAAERLRLTFASAGGLCVTAVGIDAYEA